MLLLWIFFVICVFLCHAVRYVSYSLVVTCWERANLLAPSNVMFSCVVCYFPIRCPGSGVILDCIDSWSLPFLTFKLSDFVLIMLNAKMPTIVEMSNLILIWIEHEKSYLQTRYMFATLWHRCLKQSISIFSVKITVTKFMGAISHNLEGWKANWK